MLVCTRRICLILLSVAMLSPPAISAEEISPDSSGMPDSSWTLLGGYGISHQGLGKTREKVQVLDLIPQYNRILLRNVGSSWYKGYHSLLLELPLTLVLDPDVSPMIGANVLGSWTFDSSETTQPYLFGGGGILYTNADIPGLGSEVDGNWQFGGGVRYRLQSGRWLKVEYRFHHISNAGTEDPNDPINSSKVLVGMTF